MWRMKIPVGYILVLLLSLGSIPHLAFAGEFMGGLSAGTSGGLGVQASAGLSNFTRDLPLSARFTLGYHTGNAGDPYAARQVFINDNTNGTPDGDHVNPRDGYDYSHADDAVDQPSVEVLAMMGLRVGF